MSFTITLRKQEPIQSLDAPPGSRPKQIPSVKTDILQMFIHTFGTEKHIEDTKSQLKDPQYQGINFHPCPIEKIAQQVCNFLAKWDTQDYSPLEIRQETEVWKSFFLQPHNGLRSDIRFHRKNNSAIYSIHINGPEISKITELFSKVFEDTEEQDLNFSRALLNEDYEDCLCTFTGRYEKQKKELTEQSLEFKKKVLLRTSITSMPIDYESVFLTHIKFGEICREYYGAWGIQEMDPRMIFAFALAPTLTRIEHIIYKKEQRTYFHTLEDYTTPAKIPAKL